ncbi:hypothetical protein D9M72_554160 [compost metagenome]
MVGDRRADDLALRVGAGEVGVGIDHFELDLAADELERGIAHQRARQEAGLDEDLEAVADAENLDALFRLGLDRLHDRHARCDRATAQIVAIGEAARDDDQIDIGDIRFRLPDGDRSLAGNLGEGRDHVAVAVEARKLNDG